MCADSGYQPAGKARTRLALGHHICSRILCCHSHTSIGGEDARCVKGVTVSDADAHGLVGFNAIKILLLFQLSNLAKIPQCSFYLAVRLIPGRKCLLKDLIALEALRESQKGVLTGLINERNLDPFAVAQQS